MPTRPSLPSKPAGRFRVSTSRASKTPWDISIRVKRENKAFSNGREISETEEPNGWKLVRFATTEPLPSEMVAFAVGPFDVYDGGVAGHGTPVRVITAKGHAAEGHAAAQATAAILPRLEAYTGIPYAFGKLDHLASARGSLWRGGESRIDHLPRAESAGPS